MKKTLAFFTVAGCAALSFAGAGPVQSSQSVSLTAGWNAVYLTVAPSGDAADVFADWPVSWVAAYDPASFQNTKQYSGSGSTEGTSPLGYRVWRRGNPGVTTLFGVPAGVVYVCFATNDWTGTLYGIPQAPRLSWHRSSSEESMNLVGVSTYAPTTVSDYFSGLDVGNATFRRYYGNDPADPKLGPVFQADSFGLGDVIVMDSKSVSDWSGTLFVSPLSGVSFGTNSAYAAVSVRNDGAAARTVGVRLAMGTAPNALDVPTVPPGLFCRDAANAATNGPWRAFTVDTPFFKRLEAGETLRLELALDRTAMPGAAGTYYGALLNVRDEDGGSRMLATIPLEATSDGGASAEYAWPKGIWIATAELGNVTFVGVDRSTKIKAEDIQDGGNKGPNDEEDPQAIDPKDQKDIPMTDIAAGGTMRVRLPMYVDREGNMVLLQRIRHGRDAEGTLHAYAGTATNFPPLSDLGRISTAFLPIDHPVIASASNAVFGGTATFPFPVEEHSRVNPMRHAFHPQHDGLDFDFEPGLPSGDDFQNYVSTVKPELFTITNRVTFTWDSASGTAWSPEETLRGRLVWEFDGLRHEGTLRASGPFVMKRISAVTLEP